MVPMVDTETQACAIVDAVRYARPADHEKRLVVSMVETLEAIGNIDQLVAVEGIDVFFIDPATCRRTWDTRQPRPLTSPGRKPSSTRSVSPWTRSVPQVRSPGRW
jgi:2-keto-3-deoxy-L-rhamnonate aldolase RhmA